MMIEESIVVKNQYFVLYIIGDSPESIMLNVRERRRSDTIKT